MFNKEAALLKQIDESRQAIRQKHFQLKQGLQDVQDEVSKVFKPIVKPLHEMASKTHPPPPPPKKKQKKVHHSTPWKNSYKNLLSSFPEEEDEESGDQESDEESEKESEDDTLDYKTITDSTINSVKSVNKNIVEEDLELDDYLNLLESNDLKIDTKIGVRKNKGQYMIGSAPITFAGQKILIDKKEYDETPGLLELLFKKRPKESLINESDVKNFEEIALETNLLKKDYNPNRSFIEINWNSKYLKYLKHLNPRAAKNSTLFGRGLPQFMISKADETSFDYKYWDDPNELVDRLKLLMAERSAGNNNHDSEILSIIEELREARIIY